MTMVYCGGCQAPSCWRSTLRHHSCLATTTCDCHGMMTSYYVVITFIIHYRKLGNLMLKSQHQRSVLTTYTGNNCYSNGNIIVYQQTFELIWRLAMIFLSKCYNKCRLLAPYYINVFFSLCRCLTWRYHSWKSISIDASDSLSLKFLV